MDAIDRAGQDCFYAGDDLLFLGIELVKEPLRAEIKGTPRLVVGRTTL